MIGALGTRHMSLDQLFSSKKTANFRADGSVAVVRQVSDTSGQDPIHRPSMVFAFVAAAIWDLTFLHQIMWLYHKCKPCQYLLLYTSLFSLEEGFLANMSVIEEKIILVSSPKLGSLIRQEYSSILSAIARSSASWFFAYCSWRQCWCWFSKADSMYSIALYHFSLVSLY